MRLKASIKILILSLFSITVSAQEICDNGVDDDGDGLIDLNDTDCDCTGFSSTQTIPSLIPNSSFEDNSCCPSSYSQLNCADTWVQATDATSDYFNCGYSFGAATNAGITAADGGAYVGAIFSPGWQEYVGACLLQTMQAGVTYNLQMSIASFPMDGSGNVCNGGVINYDPVDISIYGAANCSSLPWATTGCPSSSGGDWSFVTSSNYVPSSSWSTITLSITPAQDLNTIMIGAPCTLPGNYSGSCYPYFVFDNLTLAESSSFTNMTIVESGDACAGNLMLDADIDTSGGTWQWYLEGVALVGQTSDILDLSGNSLGAGTYQAVYTIGSKCDLLDYTVVMPDLPTADFSASSVCDGQPTDFQDLSSVPSGSITNWQWDFDGDGIIDATGQNPTYTYSGDGTYSTMLVVTSDLGCVDTIMSGDGSIPGYNDGSYVTVNPLPQANFDVDSVCLNSMNTYTDMSTISSGSIASWQWDFGDGVGSSSNQNDSYTYSTSGQFDVMLLVSSDQGCLDSIEQTVEVFPNPSIDFTFNNACVGAPVTFVDNSNIYGASSAVYNWDFSSDGTIDFSGLTTDHVYTVEGSYFVTLDVTTSDGCVGQGIQEVVIYPSPVAAFTGQNICEDDQVDFTNNSSVSSGSIQSYFWDFGNGDISNQQAPSQTFLDEGIYYVTLTVTSDLGCEGTVAEPIEVYPAPEVMFITSDVCDGTTANFTDLSTVSNAYTSNSLVNWVWEFGTIPPTNALGQFVSNQYAGPGTYTVTLDVTTNHSCVGSFQQDITIYPNPEVNFESPNPEGCTEWCPTIVNNSSIASGTINSYLWNMGEGTAYTDENPVHCYSNNGLQTITYDVTLTATSDFGCTTTLTNADFITVYPLPVAAFGNDPVVGTIYQPTFDFLDSSLIADEYIWTFADLGSSTASSPSFTFPDQDSGTYEVCLYVETQYGCEDMICHEVVIEGISNVYVPNSFTPNNDGINDEFMPSLYGIAEDFYEFRIFDRWGALVYETNDLNGSWDGTYLSEDCMLDVYVWKISVKDKYTGEILKYTGHVTLFR